MRSRIAVVENLDCEVVLVERNADGGPLAAGMTQDVGEALLDDAVRAVSGRRRDVRWHGIQLQVDVHPRSAHTVDELMQIGEALRRPQRSIVDVRTNDPERGAKLCERIRGALHDAL